MAEQHTTDASPVTTDHYRAMVDFLTGMVLAMDPDTWHKFIAIKAYMTAQIFDGTEFAEWNWQQFQEAFERAFPKVEIKEQ